LNAYSRISINPMPTTTSYDTERPPNRTGRPRRQHANRTQIGCLDRGKAGAQIAGFETGVIDNAACVPRHVFVDRPWCIAGIDDLHRRHLRVRTKHQVKVLLRIENPRPDRVAETGEKRHRRVGPRHGEP
jgi:hypothetical protein